MQSADLVLFALNVLYSPRLSSPFLRHSLPCPLHPLHPLHPFPSLPFAIPNPWQCRKSKRRVFAHSKKMRYGRTDGRTDRQTDGRTDRPSYRDSGMHLKRLKQRKEWRTKERGIHKRDKKREKRKENKAGYTA